MGSIRPLAEIEELKFAATATLLAIRAKKQSLSTSEQPDVELSDESEPEYDSGEDCATSRPTALFDPERRDALTNEFLDRLGEVFSREKCSVQHGKRQGSKHIAATALIRSDARSPLIILLAKNEGLDSRDREMSSQLQRWFRTVAATGRHPPVLTDILWIGNSGHDGLVEYSRGRLWYHISQMNQLSQSINTMAAQSDTYGSEISRLQRLCQSTTMNSTVRQLSDIVNAAYELRCVSKDFGANAKYMKALRSINMLGRLRAAYECFK